MTKIQALHSFWGGFGLNAYDENSVPENTPLPYITYEVADDSFDHVVYLTASIWYRANGWLEIDAKAKQIADYIGLGGRIVDYDDGAFWIRRSHVWSQRMSEPSDDTVRRIVLNVMVEFIDQ